MTGMNNKLAIICTAIILMGQVSACALPQIADINAQTYFDKYSMAEYEDGTWSAYDSEAGLLLKKIESGSAKAFLRAGACIVYPSIRGDSGTSLTEIVLNVCLLRSSPIYAQSCFIAANGVIWSAVQAPVLTEYGNYSMEQFEIPLDLHGAELLPHMAEDGFSVCIFGQNGVYKTDIFPDASQSANDKAYLESGSLSAIRSFLTIIPDACGTGYGLWAESAVKWSENRAEQRFSVESEIPDSFAGMKFDAKFGLMDIYDKKSVKAAQECLKNAGLYAGNADGKYGADTITAVKDAQRLFGMPETGIFDYWLARALAGSVQAINGAQTTTASKAEQYAVNAMDMTLNGYYYADSIALAGEDYIVSASGNNVFIVFSGEAANTSQDEILLPLLINARVVIDGKYEYPCRICCKKPGAAAPSTNLMPLETSSIVIWAEIPESAADGALELYLKNTDTDVETKITLER